MEQTTFDGTHQSKRRKLSDPETELEDESVEKHAADLFEHGTDGTGYITGNVFMIWPSVDGKKHHFILDKEASYGGQSQKHRFNVFLLGKCGRFLDHLGLKCRDRVYLSLKAAKVNKVGKSKIKIELKLYYTDGVIMKFDRKGSAATSHVINTWKSQETELTRENDWFSTPVSERQSDNRPKLSSDSLPQPTHENPITPVVSVPIASSSALHSTIETPRSTLSKTSMTNAQEVQKQPEMVEQQPPVMTKKQRRRLKQAQREAKTLQLQDSSTSLAVSPHTTEPPASIIPVLSVKSSQTAPNNQSSINTPEPQPNKPNPVALASTSTLHDVAIIGDTSTIISKKVQPGLYLHKNYYYPALDTVQPNDEVNLIGAVTFATEPSATKNQELMCRLKIADSSNVIIDNYCSRAEGFSINCFTKKYLEWLPCPKVGDVLVLHRVKTQLFNDYISGVGYSDKLQWAIYSPEKGEVHHGDRGEAPESEGLADGFGFKFSPFYHPDEREIRYCLQLSDWWQGLQAKRVEALKNAQQIGGGETQIANTFTAPLRQHRVIRDAGPSIPPNGYFDCTVEVLYGYLNDNGVYSLYVTDYTAGDGVMPARGRWCPEPLSELVLNIEMWDDAAEIGKIMQAGDYYTILNARMRRNRQGYVEAKVSENKIKRLEGKDAKSDVHLRELLERKKAWEAAHGASPTHFEHQLFENIEENTFFNCTVELLHTAYASNGISSIYVTDYTFHPGLALRQFSESWSIGLEGRIVKVDLWDAQNEMANNMSVGSYYHLKKLRFRANPSTKQFWGFLGGNERLISLLNLQNSSNEHLQDLLRRKGEYKHRTRSSNRLSTVQSNSPSTEHRVFTSFHEIKANDQFPAKFRVQAKIIDFYPLHLTDCFRVFCSQCKKDIPKNQRACFGCADTAHEYVQHFFQMFFLLEDKQGRQLKLSVSDDCSLFDGLERADLRDDHKGYIEFSKRVLPILGNLVEVHDCLENDEVLAHDTQFLELVVNTWMTASGQPAFNLATYVGAKP